MTKYGIKETKYKEGYIKTSIDDVVDVITDDAN